MKDIGVIFLDIDGVLCTDRAYLAYRQDAAKLKVRTLDPLGIKLVNRLCDDFSMELVISSTWRHHYNVHDILLTHGFTGKLFEANGKTARGSSRGSEIRDWMQTHGKNLTRALILDDVSDGIKDTALQHFWVQTSEHDGILTSHYRKAVAILKEQQRVNEIIKVTGGYVGQTESY